ncbi:MAG: glycosyltransferase family 4 protein [Candidatus Omnitrophica bacterium]|nr:glycosyltransferase family 4 protein [Candidatus Omnitrophota bacterium]
MNVCLVSREYPPETGWGGIGTYTYHLAHGLAEQGHQVHVLAQSLTGDREDVDGTVLVHRMSHKPLWVSGQWLREWGLRIEYSYQVSRALRRLVATYSIEVIEAPNFSAEGFVVSLRKLAPLVTRLHTHFAETVELNGWDKTLDHSLSCMLEEAAVLRSDLVTCSTDAHRQRVACEIGMDPVRIERIPLGVPLPVLDGDEPGGIELPHPAVLFVGRLEQRKGVQSLLRAIPQILRKEPATHFFLVGRDTYHDGRTASFESHHGVSFKEMALRQFPQECLDRVHFLGYVPPDVLDRYYRACDVFVAPSLYESFGLIYLEAMAHAKPVIGCPVGGVPEIIEDDVTGLLVPPEDPSSLAAAITRLLRDPALRQRMGSQARARVEASFNLALMVTRTVNAYQRLLA